MDAQREVAARPIGPPASSVTTPVLLADDWRVEVVDSGPLFESAERIEYEVFLEKEFCAESATGRAAEYEPWRRLSTFQVAIAPDGSIGGVIRVMFGPYGDLPVGKFERKITYPVDPVAEIASLAVPRQWRRHAGVAEALYREAWSGAVRQRATGLVAIGENWLLDLLNLGYDFGFVILGETHWYMGGDCFPIGAGLGDMARRMSRNQPEFWAWFSDRLDLRDRTALTTADGRETVIDLTTDVSASSELDLR